MIHDKVHPPQHQALPKPDHRGQHRRVRLGVDLRRGREGPPSPGALLVGLVPAETEEPCDGRGRRGGITRTWHVGSSMSSKYFCDHEGAMDAGKTLWCHSFVGWRARVWSVPIEGRSWTSTSRMVLPVMLSPEEDFARFVSWY